VSAADTSCYQKGVPGALCQPLRSNTIDRASWLTRHELRLATEHKQGDTAIDPPAEISDPPRVPVEPLVSKGLPKKVRTRPFSI
jgi:hypothetical protein